jgi:alpha-L-fucosidase
MDVPESESSLTLKAIKKAKYVELLGYGKVEFKKTKDGLTITFPKYLPNNIAMVLKIK